MKSSFWEEPLAEKVIFPTKKKCVPPKFLGFLVRLSFVVAAIVGGVLYYLQDNVQQVLEDTPVNTDCKVLGNLDGVQFLIPDFVNADPITFTLAGTGHIWVSNSANCQSLFTRGLAQPWRGSTFRSLDSINMEADGVYSPELQEAIDCVFSGNCTKYVYQDLEKVKGTTLTVFCDVRIEEFDISSQNCTTALFLRVEDHNSRTLGLDSVDAQFLCDGVPRSAQLTLKPTSGCLRSFLQTGFTNSVKHFCDTLPTRVGPYLCKETTKRSALDIVNLAFAAGSAAVIISTIVVSLLHRCLNGESEEAMKPAKGDATELT